MSDILMIILNFTLTLAQFGWFGSLCFLVLIGFYLLFHEFTTEGAGYFVIVLIAFAFFGSLIDYIHLKEEKSTQKVEIQKVMTIASINSVTNTIYITNSIQLEK